MPAQYSYLPHGYDDGIPGRLPGDTTLFLAVAWDTRGSRRKRPRGTAIVTIPKHTSRQQLHNRSTLHQFGFVCLYPQTKHGVQFIIQSLIEIILLSKLPSKFIKSQNENSELPPMQSMYDSSVVFWTILDGHNYIDGSMQKHWWNNDQADTCGLHG